MSGCSDLSPFAQGYIEAALDGQKVPAAYDGSEPVKYRVVAFSDLAPATLAAMLEDCGRWRALHPSVEDHHGGIFWECRQVVSKVAAEGFPPVHLYLADDGKIHQREAA